MVTVYLGYSGEGLEEFLFQQRMEGMRHPALSLFFKAEDLIETCGP